MHKQNNQIHEKHTFTSQRTNNMYGYITLTL